MAFVSDNRPHTLGDLIVITGTVANGDTSAALGAFLSEILHFSVTSTAAAAAPITTAIDNTTATTVHFTDPGVLGGRLIVFGKR